MAATPDGKSYYYYGSWLLVLFTCSYLAQTLWRRWSSYGGTRAQLQSPPTPPSLPIIGHLHHLLLGSISFPQKLHNLATRYGPLLQLHMGAAKFILVSDANFARDILKINELNFVDRPDFGNPDINMYFRSGLVIAPYGTYWRFMRKICVTKLLSTSQLNQFIHIREQELSKLLQYLIKVSKTNNFCDLSGPITTLSNNVICRMAMSTSPSDAGTDQAKKIKALVDELVGIAGKLSGGEILGGPLEKLDLFGYGGKLKKALSIFDQLIESIIKKHEDNSIIDKEGRDLMDILLETCNDPSAEVKLTKRDIKAFLLDMFLAGTETTSTAMKWAMSELINHPQVFKKLRQEIDSVVGHGRLVRESDVQNLPYLEAVVKETLRLHNPAVVIPRQSIEECEINGCKLEAKSRILINIYSIMRDPSSWNDPNEFIPERFLLNSISYNANPNCDYIPFGSGRRACPGASLAITMLRVAIAMLVQCFDWRVKDGERVDMTEASDFRLTLEMANSLVCYPILHFNPFTHA